jgi:hypothetical protein
VPEATLDQPMSLRHCARTSGCELRNREGPGLTFPAALMRACGAP